MSELSDTDIATLRFEKKWRNLIEISSARSKELADCLKKYQGAVFLEHMETITTEMLKRQIYYEQIALIDSLLDLYPQSSTQLISKVASMELPTGMDDLFIRIGSGAFLGKPHLSLNITRLHLEVILSRLGTCAQCFLKKNR